MRLWRRSRKQNRRNKKLIGSNSDVQMDWLFFRYKNKDPFHFLNMSPGKRLVARAYMLEELERKKEELEALAKK